MLCWVGARWGVVADAWASKLAQRVCKSQLRHFKTRGRLGMSWCRPGRIRSPTRYTAKHVGQHDAELVYSKMANPVIRGRFGVLAAYPRHPSSGYYSYSYTKSPLDYPGTSPSWSLLVDGSEALFSYSAQFLKRCTTSEALKQLETMESQQVHIYAALLLSPRGALRL